MAKQECGTCRFFEKSKNGTMGTCRNERCRDIVGFALVRKHELACRVGWDQNYYEPLPAAAIPGEERPRVDTTLQRGYQGTKPDDLVVGVEQSRPVKDGLSQSTGRKPPSHVSEAHRRALERKQQAQQAGIPVTKRRLDGVLPGPPTPLDVAANTSEEWQKQGIEGVSLPRPGDAPPAVPALPGFPPAAVGNANAPTVSLPVVEAGGDAPFTGERRDDVIFSPPPVEQRGFAPPGMPTETPGGNVPLPGGAAPLTAGDNAAGDLNVEWYAARRVEHRGKRCANCRDFRRPTEGSDHGYCKNRWAFPAPQAVQPSDLACLSALGTWWSADDAWWSARPLPERRDEVRTDRAANEWQVGGDRPRSRRHPGLE